MDYYGADNTVCVRQTTSHLISLGHVSFGFVRGPLTSTSIQWEQGFRDAMEAACLTVNERRVVEGDYTREGCYRSTRPLLERLPRPTAIVCASDMMALGVLDAALELGLDVPRDLAVVGVDDILIASLRSVGLTTIRFDLDAVVELGIRKLLAKISDTTPHEHPDHLTLPRDLVMRQSCGADLDALARRA